MNPGIFLASYNHMKTKKKSARKEMPFHSFKKRKEHKQFTKKVALLCLSLFTLIILEKEIVLYGKEMLFSKTKSAKKTSFKHFEELEIDWNLKRKIKRDIAKTHQILHKKKMPESHFILPQDQDIIEDDI